MGVLPNLIYFAGVARGSVLLAEYSDGEPELAQVCVQQLERVAGNHSRYNYTSRGRMISCLMHDGFSFCGVIDEALGPQDAFKFLGEVRDAFWKFLSWRGLPQDGAGLAALSLDVDFGPILKRLAAPYVGIPQQESAGQEEEFPAGENGEAGGRADALPPFSSDLNASQESVALNVAAHRKEKDGGDRKSACSPLGGGKGKKQEKRKAKDLVTQSKEIVRETSGRLAPGKGDTVEVVVAGPSRSGELSPRMNGHVDSRMKGHQLAQRTWWSNVKFVLFLDVIVCVLLFAVWLGICRGFQCLSKRNG